jgi:hypothetical protein
MTVKTKEELLELAHEIAKVCFDHGILLNGCGCCGTLEYKGVDFDRFVISEDGEVQGSALTSVNGKMERVHFGFNVKVG